MNVRCVDLSWALLSDLWVDFAQLQRIMFAIFGVLDRVRLDDFERVREGA